MSKLGWLQFFIGDWMKDPALSMCSPSTRGIWMDLLCAMHENNRSGLIAGSRDQLSRLCRCTAVELDAAIHELSSTKTSTVTIRNGIVTVINRRMKRESNERDKGKERVRKHRYGVDCNENVTVNVTELKHPIYRDRDKDTENTKEKNKKENQDFLLEFEKLWEEYPSKDGKKSAQKHFFSSVKSREDLRNIKLAVFNYKNYLSETGAFAKNGSTFFNNWDDYVDSKSVAEMIKARKGFNNQTQDKFLTPAMEFLEGRKQYERHGFCGDNKQVVGLESADDNAGDD